MISLKFIPGGISLSIIRVDKFMKHDIDPLAYSMLSGYRKILLDKLLTIK